MWMTRLMMVWCLALVAFTGCEKKQHDVEVVPKSQQAAAPSAPSSTAPASQVSGESTPQPKVSEQQSRAVRR